MNTEDKSQIPLFSPEDEKEAQKELKRLRKNENGVIKVNHKRTGFEDKTLWDWLQLLGILAIPLVVAGATLFFGIQQANLAQQQHDSDQHRSTDQQQATTLQTYIDNIQDLLLNHNLLGDNPKPKNDSDNIKIQEVQELARSRTLTALQGLDSDRKGRLVQFLYEAQLINFEVGQPPIVNIYQANFSGTNLSNFYLSDADLSYTNLTHANLTHTYLSNANLSNANLSDANLSDAYLYDAYLDGYTNLSGAILANAILPNVNLTQQQLDQVLTCKGAILPTGLTCYQNQ